MHRHTHVFIDTNIPPYTCTHTRIYISACTRTLQALLSWLTSPLTEANLVFPHASATEHLPSTPLSVSGAAWGQVRLAWAGLPPHPRGTTLSCLWDAGADNSHLHIYIKYFTINVLQADGFLFHLSEKHAILHPQSLCCPSEIHHVPVITVSRVDFALFLISLF